jgi:predicted  nucleic acid-binding Zn-ribbon protein
MTSEELEDYEQKQHALDALNDRAHLLKGKLEDVVNDVEWLEKKLDELLAKAEKLKNLTD